MSKLKKIRKDRGMQQDTLAKMLGVSQAGVSFWERKDQVPAEFHEQLGEIFGVEPETFRSPVIELGAELESVEDELRAVITRAGELQNRLQKARQILGKRKRYSRDAA